MLSNRLTVLAAEVKEHLAQSTQAEHGAAAFAIAAGTALCDAKALCGHGSWLPFLQAAGIQERKAQRYMRLAKSGLNPSMASDLGGVYATLRWLERARLPVENEYLVVTVDGADGELARVAVAWTDRGGYSFAILGIETHDAFAATSIRPMVKPDSFWLLLFHCLGGATDDIRFVPIGADVGISIRHLLATFCTSSGAPVAPAAAAGSC